MRDSQDNSSATNSEERGSGGLNNNPEDIYAVILAAGKGSRMRSALPKVLHAVNGKPMISWVIDACRGAGVSRPLVVIGAEGEAVSAAVGDAADYVLQRKPEGTGQALSLALPYVPDGADMLVLCGDTPLLTAQTLSAMAEKRRKSGAAGVVLTAHTENPAGYGRIRRDGEGRVLAIVEEKDADEPARAINEINTGAYCFCPRSLRRVIGKLRTDNAQKEYYLTDLAALLAAEGLFVLAHTLEDRTEAMGINDRVQLAAASDMLRRRKNQRLMSEGVSIINPAATYIEEGVRVGADTVIEPNTFLRGATRIGSGCRIGPSCDITDSVIGKNSAVRYAVLNGAAAGDGADIGPYAHLRPGTVLAEGVKIGGFVETKKVSAGKGSKIPHLSYIGDAEIGAGVNIGCGVITCNYDGHGKFATVIGDGAFIGSNANLIAPVEVGEGAYVAAGTTVSVDVPENALAIGRSKQANIPGWAERRREARGKKKETVKKEVKKK